MPVHEGKPYATADEFLEAIVAYWWRQFREEGMAEAQFRAQLDPKEPALAGFRDGTRPLPEYRPHTAITREETTTVSRQFADFGTHHLHE